MSNLPAFKLVVPADFEYVDRTLATASWYDVYTIKAGEYPIKFVTSRFTPVVEDIKNAYYATWEASAILTEEYRVNRLFTASSAHTTTPNTLTTVHGSTYAYNVLNSEGTITAYTTFGNADNGWERTINATIVPA